MSLRTVLLLLLIIALAVFVVANWAAFTAPTTLSLLVGTIEAPLGLIMLMITAALAAVFLAYVFYLQTSVLLETRRMTRELAAQRQLADEAEASRFTELRANLEARLDRLEEGVRSASAGGTPDLGRLRDELRLIVDQAANGIAAQIAELDDHLGRR
ncbi:MAG: hypothetical protein ACM3JC_12940 [Rudaea sp.]